MKSWQNYENWILENVRLLFKETAEAGDYTVCYFMELSATPAQYPRHHLLQDDEKICFDLEADALVILHNHPKLKNRNLSSVSPSEDDIIGTYAVARICLSNKMNLIDHIIVDTDNYFSFVENQLIDLN